MNEISKVLIVGGTGYIGRRIVKASIGEGHETYVLQRREIGLADIEKLQILLSFKEQGAHLVEASFSDHQSLVNAVKLVDVVICAMSGVHFRTHNILMQLKLVDAIKAAGNIKRFLPSEFGLDPAKMGDALEPIKETFDEKMAIRKAIEEAKIPFTYISANCMAAYFAGNLSQFGSVIPAKPDTTVNVFGHGNCKAVYMDEDDIGTYTIKAMNDPRTLNKTVYLQPPENILTQTQLIAIWEKLIGEELDKRYIPAQDFLAIMKGLDYAGQAGAGLYYHIYYEGSCLANIEIGVDGEEASVLYPQVEYTRMTSYLKRYL